MESITPQYSESVETINVVTSPRPPIRRIYRRRTGGASVNVIPDSILKNQSLLQCIATSLPKDYEFEIPKTIWRIEQLQAHSVALQMPEGLLMYSCIIADILRRYSCARNISILGDVTYGACCIDDLGAKALGVQLLVHYGHSCLVPINTTVVPCLYVFVEIRIDVQHLVDSFCQTCDSHIHTYCMGTIQFRTAVAEVAALLNERGWSATIPKASPLSPGEVLGCTAPNIQTSPGLGSSGEKSIMLFIADGRFHLEAAMIANPDLRALRYDPYSKVLTDERYETKKMLSLRKRAIQEAASDNVKCFGIILGTLGRQGNVGILAGVRSILKKHGKKSVIVLLSEIFPQKLALFKDVDAWVQIACPRLSVDWGHYFQKPLLTAYELYVTLGEESFRDIYPMDFYAVGSGEWTNYHMKNKDRNMLNTT